jgi:hypothetical protein
VVGNHAWDFSSVAIPHCWTLSIASYHAFPRSLRHGFLFTSVDREKRSQSGTNMAEKHTLPLVQSGFADIQLINAMLAKAWTVAVIM